MVIGTTPATASQQLAAAQSQPGSPLQASVAQSFQTVSGSLRPQFPAAALAGETKLANVSLPQLCSGAMHLADASSGAAVDVTLAGALPVVGQTAGGYVVYPGGFGSGATVLHRPLPSGSEDFVSLPTRPATPEVDYSVSLGTNVAGLRLVGGTLEMLDASGTPRFHVPPPYIVGADGVRTDGALAVNGCAVDTDPSPSWGRAVTPAGAASCTVRVTWPDAAVVYPAILDPRWTTTGSMGTARFEHTVLLLSTGRALAAGGRSSTSGTTGLTTAELYDPTTGTWSSTGSMAHGRRLHSMTQLGSSSNGTTSGKVLVAGGISGTTSTNTAELYSPSAGTWIAAGNLDVARHAHTATLLADGRVLAAGGLNGTTMLTTAVLYNPASGAGSWVPTTGPIPPTGIKNHTATLIQTTNTQLNNHVLLVGGNNGSSTSSSVYLFDPVQNAFSTLPSIPSPREQHTAVTLANTNGKILVTGGKNGSSVLASAVVFDPGFSNGTWSSAGTMTSPRVGQAMTLLPNSIVANGQVLVSGGSSTGSDTLSTAELFSGTSTWTATPSMPGPLQGHQAVLLGGNMVLVAGGLSSTSTVQPSAFLYDASFGLSCTSNSQCPSGFCASGVCCSTACADQCHACNLAGSLGTCSVKANGATCSDGNACTQTDTCQSGTCTGGNPKTCTASDQCHTAGTCAPATGVCSNPTVANGTTCNDGNLCTQTDTCQSGTCTGGNPKTCTASDQCHTAGTCAPATGVCSNPTAANGTTCNDGNLCTQTDTCQSGTCTGGNPKTCTASDQCHVAGTCAPGTGVCSNPTAANGTTCNDSNACTTGETCQSGACSGGSPVTCTADQCHTVGACVPASGCPVPVAKSNGTSCNDNNLCTRTDSCQGGACVGGNAVVCTASDQCHAAGTCSPASGTCSNPTATDGTLCNDGNACTQTDTCQAGTCSGGNPALFGVPESDPTATKCADGTAPVGCRGFDCNTGVSTAWLATPVCSQSVSCTATCAASGCVPQNQRGGAVVQCDCSCADPTGGTPLTLTVQACGSSTTSCAALCAQGSEACSTGNCAVGACAPAAGASPETALAGSCRGSDSGAVASIAPFSATVDTTSSRLVANIGGNSISSPITGTVGFSSGAVSPGTFALTSLQAQVTGPVQFFGRQVDSLQVNLRRPLFGAEVPGESGFQQFTLPVHPDDLAAQVVVGGVAQFLSLDAVGSLTGAISSDGTVLLLQGSQTQPSGDSMSMVLTAFATNSPPQPTITVTPGTTLECTGNLSAGATFNATTVDPNPGDSIKRIQWFVRDDNGIDAQATVLGAGSVVTAPLQLGTYDVTTIAYDEHEAAGRSTVQVQVRDTVAPTIVAPPDTTFYAGVGGTSLEVNLGEANIHEACDPSPTVSVVTSMDPDSPLRGVTIPVPTDVVLPLGQIPIVWTVTDAAGNTASATQTVTVVAQDLPIGTPPPPAITIGAPPTCTGGAVPVTPPGSPSVSVDVKVCVVGRINAGVREGAAPWENCTTDDCTNQQIQALLAPAQQDYSGFVSFNYAGFKRIRDPYFPNADGTEPNDPCGYDPDDPTPRHYGDTCIVGGDIGSDLGPEGDTMQSECWAMWGYPEPGGANDACQRSIMLVLFRGSEANQICGIASAAESITQPICVNPETVADNTRGAFAFASTETGFGLVDCTSSSDFVVAHELGHTLGLIHGDGLDNDCNGVWDGIPGTGPVCDPTEMNTGPATLMTAEGASTGFLTSLQLDRARVYATKSLPMAASSSSVCVAPPLPAAPVDTAAAPPPPVGCGCGVAGSRTSIWSLALIGLLVLSRRRPRPRI